MSREEIQKLLGGYATDTLSEEERRALYEAALEDQDLFDALAKEQALREVLNDPFARQQLLNALGPTRTPAMQRVWRWLRQPAALAVAGGLAILLVVAGLSLRRAEIPSHRKFAIVQVRPQPTPSPSPQAATPPKLFELPRPRQYAKQQAVLPGPPAINPEYDVQNLLRLPVGPAPQPPGTDTIARLTASAAASPAQSAEIARQLYSRPNAPAMGFIGGRLPQARAKMARTGAAVPMASNFGVRYSLLLKNTDGEYAPTRLDTGFHPGDSIRLRLVPNDSGYLYLFQRDSSGGWRLASTQRVEARQPCLFPASGALQYDEPGRKQLLVVLSPREEPSLASLETAGLDALAASVRADILKATVSSGESAYAVDTRPQAGQQKVAFEITLEFR